MKTFLTLALAILPLGAMAAPAQEDNRTAVSIPAADLAELKTRMRRWQADHASATAALAAGKTQEAGALVYNSSGPGDVKQYGQPPALKAMPEGMAAMGKAMRSASNRMSELSKTTPDTATMLRAFNEVQSTCVACHASFRVESINNEGGAK